MPATKAEIDLDLLARTYIETGRITSAAAAVGVSPRTLERRRKVEPDLDRTLTEARAAAREKRRQRLPHGRTRYNYGCRCEVCTTANREAQRRQKKARLERSPEEIPHGLNGYRNYGCKCETCSTAAREAMTAYRAGLKGVA